MESNFFTIVLLEKAFTMISWVTQMEIIYKRYTPGMLTYQYTTFVFIKLLEFNIISSCLWYNIS